MTDQPSHLALDSRLAGIVTPHDGRCHVENNIYTGSTRMVRDLSGRPLGYKFACGKAVIVCSENLPNPQIWVSCNAYCCTSKCYSSSLPSKFLEQHRSLCASPHNTPLSRAQRDTFFPFTPTAPWEQREPGLYGNPVTKCQRALWTLCVE
ncbi:hypothetical protein GOODEAATRI_005564 [Goodea atripinnis]|uniref:Integrin beta subunit VWA domain-containing protein n=1 Tax=Goodea atripinnis TaxID=208336 RepID=A0ABV0N867_9TELE